MTGIAVGALLSWALSGVRRLFRGARLELGGVILPIVYTALGFRSELMSALRVQLQLRVEDARQTAA